ncbi:hypothetical protein ACIQOV_17320 [Kitasatospora sp. NPDC091257]|uniref:hypothetical protein n=1 Tax=Kitasatospora sp. NPDC091257 TaxID=3364084 RepID=UPI0037FE7EC6
MDRYEDLPGEVKVIDTPTLLRLQERAEGLGLAQRLGRAWVRAHADPQGRHWLRPALWHGLTHRPELPRQLRCEAALAVRGGDRVRSLLDVLPEDFAPLRTATSRDRVWMPVGGVLSAGDRTARQDEG